jgi:adenine phosphoribosyltransferase
LTSLLSTRVETALRVIPDFPVAGIQFRDITPLLADAELFAQVVDAMVSAHAHLGITHVVGIESRGFMFGVPIAMALRAAFVPARKPGKLPHVTVRESYALEYGDNTLEMHADALEASARVLIVDDVLATGGTASATASLVRQLGGTVLGIAVLAEIDALDGRNRLSGTPVWSLVVV